MSAMIEVFVRDLLTEIAVAKEERACSNPERRARKL